MLRRPVFSTVNTYVLDLDKELTFLRVQHAAQKAIAHRRGGRRVFCAARCASCNHGSEALRNEFILSAALPYDFNQQRETPSRSYASSELATGVRESVDLFYRDDSIFILPFEASAKLLLRNIAKDAELLCSLFVTVSIRTIASLEKREYRVVFDIYDYSELSIGVKNIPGGSIRSRDSKNTFINRETVVRSF